MPRGVPTADDAVEFHLTVDKDAWVGVGFSKDGTMTSGGDGTPAVLGQFFEGGAGLASWNSLSEYSMGGIVRIEAVMPSVDAGQADGRSWVRFSVPYHRACADAAVAVCAGQKRKLILAYGGKPAFFDGDVHAKAISVRLAPWMRLARPAN